MKNYSWLITRPIIDEIKQRLDIDQESKNMSSDITSFSAESSEVEIINKILRIN